MVIMTGMQIGYARVSTDGQDLTAQRNALLEIGVDEERIYFDHGMTGTNRTRPGLKEALAACRRGDVLVVTKLDRLARSVSDARGIADDLVARGVALKFEGSLYDPASASGKLMFNMLAVIAEFEADLIRSRTREGMKLAKAKGRLRGKQPKLTKLQQQSVIKMHRDGEHTQAELADIFGVARSTIYRTLQRHAEITNADGDPSRHEPSKPLQAG